SALYSRSNSPRGAAPHRCASAPPGAVGIAGVLVFPDDLAGTVHFADAMHALAGRQDVTVGQGAGRQHARNVPLEPFLAFAVELHDLADRGAGDEYVAIRQQINAALALVTVAGGGEGGQLLAGRVQQQALFILRQAKDVAAPRAPGSPHATGN